MKDKINKACFNIRVFRLKKNILYIIIYLSIAMSTSYRRVQ